MRKQDFCICENIDTDQLRSNCAADQRLCFRFIDSIIPLLLKSEISSLLSHLNSVAVQPGLCRTWSETPKTGFLTTRLIHFQLTEFIWVQCDHPNCQKWRRIPTANGDDLGDEPWYCSMNPDPNMNSCGAIEEDHRRYDRMAKKAGVKFVMSMLNVGTLVWARTPGYCR